MKWFWWLLIYLLPLSAHSQSITIWAPYTTLCEGNTAIFYAGASGVAVPHYQWQVNSVAAGTDSTTFRTAALHNNDTIQCRLTNASGATLAISSKIIVHINPQPHAGVITGPDKVCAGATVTLSDSVAGGHWFALSDHLAVDSTGVVTGSVLYYHSCDTLYPETIFYTVSNSCGADTAIKSITVHPRPDARFWVQEISWGYGALCAGTGWYPLGSYSCDPVFYSAYGKIAISGSSISKGTPGGDSIYSVTTNYCGTASYGTWIYFGGPPEKIHILADFDELCMGKSDTLKSDHSCRWYSGNHKVSLESLYYTSRQVVTAIDTGTDVISVERQGQCGSAYNSIKISVKANPNPNPFDLPPKACKGSSGVLFDSTANGTWASNATNITIDKNIITFVDTGKATITYSLKGACTISAQVTVDDCIAVVELFPNPAKDELVIHLTQGGFTDCAITNSLGQAVAKTRIIQEYTGINTSLLAPGIYYIKLTGHNGTYCSKFLKE